VTETSSRSCTAFEGSRLLSAGPLAEVALAVRRAAGRGTGAAILVFDDATGGVVDLDLRGSDDDVLARLAPAGGATAAPPEPEPAAGRRRGRGRPRLGVVPREVTLLPRHWEWLAAQPGGASVTLRRLVEEARRAGGEQERSRRARDAGYRFMVAMAGDRPGFEEAARALFAGDRVGFERQIAGWPGDVRDYAVRLAFG
jgi:hypothetical protein